VGKSNIDPRRDGKPRYCMLCGAATFNKFDRGQAHKIAVWVEEDSLEITCTACGGAKIPIQRVDSA